jgi:SSS family solute:Na+ symporter
MLMAFYMFAACVLFQILLTVLFPKAAHEDPQKLYWENPLDCVRTPGWPGLGDYRILAAAVSVCFLVLYFLFK